MSRSTVKAEKETKDAAVETPVENQTQEQEQETTETAEAPVAVPAKKGKTYTVTVKGNGAFCGVGAGGVQFANGKAVGVSPRMAAWFKEHPGYEVAADK